MCLPSAPKAPPPPPAPEPPPPVPTPVDEGVTSARSRADVRRRLAGNRQSTLLQGELTAPAENATRKTLLGQ